MTARCPPLRLTGGGRDAGGSPVERLAAFLADHPDVRVIAPYPAGHGRWIAILPAGAVPGERREHVVESLDLAGLMDQLDIIYPPGTTKGTRP